ncbi:MAG: adenine phosphoribosyltransferase [Deltaproteobacteria bacterium]|nr:adenine phosphoribosyltransferase [Deltaproteobacteria bacterium]
MEHLTLDAVKKLVRDIPDFPKKGILFKDITPALAHPRALGFICDELTKPFRDKKIDKVLAIESRGFFFGTGIAERLGAGLVPVRKAGKLPWECERESYALEYGDATPTTCWQPEARSELRKF